MSTAGDSIEFGTPKKEGGTTDKFIYGFYKGRLVHIDDEDVINGLACDCFCPGCDGELIASKNPGRRIATYFKHASGKPCKYAHESALHYLAKEIIQKAGNLMIPQIEYRLLDNPSQYYRGWIYEHGEQSDAPLPTEGLQRTRKAKGQKNGEVREKLFGNRRIYAAKYEDLCYWWSSFFRCFVLPYEQQLSWKPITFNSVEVEKWEGTFKPDLRCELGGRKLFIEIAVTHFVDPEKKRKVEEMGHSLLEIDLSDVPRDSQVDVLEEIFDEGDSKRFRWIYNRANEPRHQQIEAFCQSVSGYLEADSSQVRLKKMYGLDDLVYKCPIKPAGSEPVCEMECKECRFYLGTVQQAGNDPSSYPDYFVRCIGHQAQRISKGIDDFISTRHWAHKAEEILSTNDFTLGF